MNSSQILCLKIFMKHDSVVVLVLRKASSMLGFTWLRKTYQFFLPHKKRCSNTYYKYLYSFYPKIDAFLTFCENQQILIFRSSSICLIPKNIALKYPNKNSKLFQNPIIRFLVEWHFNFLQRLICSLKGFFITKLLI